MSPATTEWLSETVHTDKQIRLRGRWRLKAWKRAQEGRLQQAVALQRVLVNGDSRGSGREGLRDRFRLLRWELLLGSWGEAEESVRVLENKLRNMGSRPGSLSVWLSLACAMARFQRGEGRRFRSSLAVALRSARSLPRGRTARVCGLRMALLQRRLACDQGPRADFPADDPERISSLCTEISRLARTGRQIPGRAFSWGQLLELIEGPEHFAPLGACWGRLRDRGEVGDPENGSSGEVWLSCWLSRIEPEPGRLAFPAWFIALLSQHVEEHVPELEPAARDRLHRVLSHLIPQIGEPWVRAAMLKALAEVALWLTQGSAPSAPELRRVEAALSQARHDLAMAAGLFSRMVWRERAAGCEQRWAKMAWPALSRSPSCEPVPSVSVLPSPMNLARVRQSLADAGFITGDIRSLRELTPLLLLAATPLPVLILGESGTGKEVIARALHRWSQLRGDFVPIHCGAIPRDLLESELFGHSRGAFTGALVEKAGLVEAADGGSLFLDEIGEMGPEAQMKMLRVLESGEVRRLGDLRPRRSQLRLIAATHRNLERDVQAGAFRLDLYYRIRGLVVSLRPLRERRGDIPLLVAHFLAQTAGSGPPLQVPERALSRLLGYHWPGNVRELRSVLVQAAHLSRALGVRTMAPEFLGLEGDPARPTAGMALDLGGPAKEEREAMAGPLWGLPAKTMVESAGLEAVLEDMERRLIINALEENGWNRTHAARSLGNLSRTTLLSKMKRLGIQAGAGEGDEVSLADAG